MDNMSGKDDIGHLIRDAGARESVSAERLEAARTRVAEHWQDVVTEQQAARQPSYIGFAAAAAAIFAAVLLSVFLRSPDAPVTHVQTATVNKVVGDVRIDGTLATTGTVIAPNSTIATGNDGMLALDLMSGQSLRVGTNTHLASETGNQFSLENGRVYIDSNPGNQNSPVFIKTRFGTATHIGTQFQVLLEPESLQIGVREGLVALNRDDGAATEIGLGTLFTVYAGRSDKEEDISADDELWQWTSEITPNFETDGATLAEYLVWYSRQAGFKLSWRDAQSRSIADRTTLDGSIDGLSLEDGLRAIHRIAPFEYTLADGILVVKVR